jgi:acetyl-CoA carboxylase biotin carboxyl carrier protein
VKLGLWEEGEGTATLRSPAVGVFRPSLVLGGCVTGGELLGRLQILGRSHDVRVPSLCAVYRITYLYRGDTEYGGTLMVVNLGDAESGERVTSEGPADLPDGAAAVRAPIDGMFFSASSPEDPPFVTVGATVEDGQIVGLVEVMKFFYEIRAEGVSGTVTRIDVSNADAVESGDPILWVVP